MVKKKSQETLPLLKKPITKISIAFVFLLIFFLVYRDFVIFSVLLIAAGSLHYIGYRRELKLNFGHVFFISLILARETSILSAIAFLILGGLLPELLLGSIEAKTFLAYPISIIFLFIISLLHSGNIIIIGTIISSINYIVILFASNIAGEPPTDLITEAVLALVMNIIYFLTLGEPLSLLFRILTKA